MPTHTPSNKLQLRALIQHAIERDGPGCDLSGIDVSRITDFSYTFMNLSFFGNVSTWRMTQAQTVRNMFEKAILSTDLSAWDTSNVEDFSAMFEHASGRVGDIGLWNTRSARNMSAMFAHSSLGADLRYWDVGHVRSGSLVTDYPPWHSIRALMPKSLPVSLLVLCIGTGHGQQASPSACVGWTPPMRSFWRCTSACSGADTARFVCAIATCTNRSLNPDQS